MENNNDKISNNNSPFNLKLLCELTKSSYGNYDLDNTFAVFKTVDNLLYLVYSTKTKSIICLDLENKQVINEIKNHHKKHLSNLRHYFDEINKRDLIISISDRDNNVRLWNVKNWDCILNIPNINNIGYICSACIINDSNNNYLISSNCSMFHDIDDSEPLKIFNFKGKKIKEIKESNEKTFFVDTFYDIKTSINYIITGNNNYLKSYDYKKNKLFHKYFDSDTGVHISIIINEDKEIIRLIESCSDGNIRIWNFHSAELLSKIKVDDDWLFGICLWNNDYLFVACKDKIIRLIQLKEGLIVKYLEGHQHGIFSMKKINIPKYGECLLSQGYDIDQIKLWVSKDCIK